MTPKGSVLSRQDTDWGHIMDTIPSEGGSKRLKIMQGHTDRATINDRRPLTKGMLEILYMLAAHGGWKSLVPTPSHGEKAQIRALLDRGLIDYEPGRYPRVKLNEDGKSALAKIP